MSLHPDIHKKKLIERFLNGKANEQELIAFFGLLNRDELHQLIEEYMDRDIELIQTAKGAKQIKRIRWWRISAAAAVFALITSFAYVFLYAPAAREPMIARIEQKNIRGSNKATITLANGNQIVLTGAGQHLLAKQGNTAITLKNDQVVYQAGLKSGALQYNTLNTARGGQYHLILSDGTNVWLNAASSIKYPVAFTGNTRSVELEGEGYFEVAKDAARPFLVQLPKGETVKVLGTHFNISAYADDNHMQTTLLEGKVEITNVLNQVLLKPGQMAENNINKKFLVHPADTEAVMAWRNGLFVFNHQPMADILRNVSRWYDVDFDYPEEIGRKKLWGTASKNESIIQLLDNIATISGIHYKITGRRILIMK